MPSDRKKPDVALWATVTLVAVLAGYPLSFGPACWLADRHSNVWKPVWNFYYPLAAITERQPKFLSDALERYGEWGSRNSPYGIPIALELRINAMIKIPRQ